MASNGAVSLKALRYSAEMDASSYVRGMAAKVAADQAGAASAKAVGAALAQTDAAMDAASGHNARLARTLIDGYGSAARFESIIRQIGRAVDTGLGLDRAAVLVEAANRKFGLTADAAALVRQGFVSVAPVVAQVNALYREQAQTADQAAAATRRLAEAQQASSRIVSGMGMIGGPRVAELQAGQRIIEGMAAAGVAAAQANVRAFSELDPVFAKLGADAIANQRLLVGMGDAGQAAFTKIATAAGQAAAAENLAASRQLISGMGAIGGPRVADMASSDRLVAGMTAATAGAGTMRGALKLTSYEMQNLGYQINDVVVSLVSGQRPLTVAFQQGAQAGQIFGSRLKEIPAALGAALLTPLGQVGIVVGLVSAGLGAMFLHERSQAQAAEDALKRHIDLIGRIKTAYDEAGGAVGKYGSESLRVLEAIDAEQQKIVRAQLNKQAADLQSLPGWQGSVGLNLAAGTITKQTADAIREINSEGRAGTADWRRYGEALVTALHEPGIKEGQKGIIQGLLDEAAAHIQVAAGLEKTKQELIAIANANDPRRQAIRSSESDQGDLAHFKYQQPIDAAALTASYDAQLLSIRAISREEQIAAAQASVRVNAMQNGKIVAQEQLAIDRAGNLAAAQFDEQQRQSFDARVRAMAQGVDSARLDLSLTGASVGEATRLRTQAELIAAAKEASATHDFISETEKARIAATADEMGRLAQKSQLVQLQSDLAFDRSQMGRTQTERQVADEMHRLWGDDYPKYMNSATAQSVRFNAELEKTVDRLDAIRGTTKQTISTLLEGFEDKDLGGAIESALKNIRSRLNDAAAGTITDALTGQQGQLGGGVFGGFLSKLMGANAAARGASPVAPLYVSVVNALGGGIPIPGAGGIGSIFGDIFNGRGASTSASGGGQSAILDLIARAEGTAGRGDYNASLGYGALTGGEHNLSGMTLDQIDALQSRMLQNPANTWNSSALGRYQITQTTMRGLRSQYGLAGNEFYDPSMQDRMGGWLLDRRGGDVGGLRNEWAGLKGVDSSEIQKALAQSSKQIGDASTKFSGDFSGSLTSLSGGMQQSVDSFSPKFGGSLQGLLSLFQQSGLSVNAFTYGISSIPGLHATGGPIHGPGTGTSDSIVARISNGEYIVNARATSMHRGTLDAINYGTPAYASGGYAGAPATFSVGAVKIVNQGTPQEATQATTKRNATGGFDLEVVTRDLVKRVGATYGLKRPGRPLGTN